jgi:hypothetical protein
MAGGHDVDSEHSECAELQRGSPWAYFCSFQTITCFEMGPPLRREEGSDCNWSLLFYWRATLLALTLTHSTLIRFEWLTSALLLPTNNWTTSPRWIAPARAAHKTYLPLLSVLSFPGKLRAHRAVPQQRLLYYRLFTQLLLGSGSTYTILSKVQDVKCRKPFPSRNKAMFLASPIISYI